MIRARVGKPKGDHVGIADGLDLLAAEAGREFVEGREDGIEKPDQFAGVWRPAIRVKPTMSANTMLTSSA
jgi:hypothetical protein